MDRYHSIMTDKILHRILVSMIFISSAISYNSRPAYGAAIASVVMSHADADRYIKFRNDLSSVLPTNNWNDALDHMSSYFSKNKSVLTVKTLDDVVAIWQLRILCTADRAALGTLLGMPDGSLGVRLNTFMNELDKVLIQNMQDWMKTATPEQRDEAVHNFGYLSNKMLSASLDKFDSLRTASNRQQKYKRAQSLFEAIYFITEYQEVFYGENAYRQQTMAGFGERLEEVQFSVENHTKSQKRLMIIQKLPVWEEIFGGF